MLITDALERFETQLRADGRSVHSIGQYCRHVTVLAQWAARAGLSGLVVELGHEHLAQFLASPVATTGRGGAPKKSTSMNAMRSSLRTFFGYLVNAGYVQVNAARLIRNAITEPPPARALSVGEEQRLVAVLREAEGFEKERDAMLFMLLLKCGLRLGSALRLDVEDVDLDGRALRVWQKGDRLGVVYFASSLLGELKVFIGKGEGGPLFCNRSGCRITIRQAQRSFRALSELAGLPSSASPHTLRHTFATGLLRRTGDMALVQAALGHRSAASTMIYARVDGCRIRDALT